MRARATDATSSRPALLGLRGRLLWVAVVLLASSAATSLLVQARVLTTEVRAGTLAALEREAAEFERVADGRNPETGDPWGDDVRGIFDAYLRRNVQPQERVVVTLVGGDVHRAQGARADSVLDSEDLLAQWSGLTDTAQGTARTGSGAVEWLAVPLLDGRRPVATFVISQFTSESEDRLAAAIWRSAVVSALVLLLAVVGAWVAMGRALRPLHEVSTTAREIEEADLSRRIHVSGNDEVAELAHTFNAMLDRLEQAFSAQRDLVNDAGHELRVPITIIRGHLDVMSDDPQDIRTTVELVSDELKRMARMVDDLLMLATLEQPDFLVPEVVAVDRLTAELARKATQLGDRPWTHQLAAGGEALWDRQRVVQAVLQLVQNALQYSPEGSPVELGSREVAAGEVEIWVRDHGPGVPSGDRTRLFERFVRGDGARRHHEGAGLGLSIVAGIASAHGGRVRVEDAPGGGARFVLSLPRRPAG